MAKEKRNVLPDEIVVLLQKHHLELIEGTFLGFDILRLVNKRIEETRKEFLDLLLSERYSRSEMIEIYKPLEVKDVKQ